MTVKERREAAARAKIPNAENQTAEKHPRPVGAAPKTLNRNLK